MGQRRLTWSDIPRALFLTGRLALSPVVVVVGVLMVTGASGYVSATSGPSPAAGRGSPGATRGGAAAASAAPSAPDSSTLACPMMPAPSTAGEGNASAGNGSVGSASHLFTRTTADGVTIRTYHLSSTGPCGCGSSAAVSVELSDTSAVGEGSLVDEPDPVATTANARSGPIGLASGAFGVVEGAPVWWTAVTVGPGVATISMTFPGGSSDQMSPVDGVAVLAGQIKTSDASAGDGPYEVRGTLRLLEASGAVVTTVTLPESTPTPTQPPTAIPTPVTLPISVPANRTTPVLGTISSPSAQSSAPSSAPSSSSGSSSGSTTSPPPTGAGSMIACAGQVAPGEASAR